MGISDVFGSNKVLLPVVHVNEDKNRTRENVAVAKEAHADGIFLINHSVGAYKLLGTYKVIRMYNPGLWIGLNLLDLPDPTEAFRALPEDADGLWVDNARLDAGEGAQRAIRSAWQKAKERNEKLLYFGSVAFKYQAEEPDPAGAAKKATAFMDVVTTSGVATGMPPSVAKIAEMRKAIGSYPLAIASGITPVNVWDYLAHIDVFMVSTGISIEKDVLDPNLTSLLAMVIHCAGGAQSHG